MTTIYPDPHRSGRSHRQLRRRCRRIRRWRTQIFVSGTPGLREDGTPPEDFTDEARQCWANVEKALAKAGAKLTDIVYMRQWLTSRDHVSAYLAVSKEIIHHQPAAMLSIIDGLVWPNLRVEVEVTAVLPA